MKPHNEICDNCHHKSYACEEGPCETVDEEAMNAEQMTEFDPVMDMMGGQSYATAGENTEKGE